MNIVRELMMNPSDSADCVSYRVWFNVELQQAV